MVGTGAAVDEDQQHPRPYALLVPSSAHGHVNPFMQLAKSLALLGFRVSFIYFSSYHAKLKADQQFVLPPCGQEPSASTAGNVHVVDDGFDANINMMHFLAHSPAMEENLYNLILQLQEQGIPPTCLISDSLEPWTVDVADRAGIPRIDFCTSNALSYLLFSSIPFLFAEGIFPEKGNSDETPLMLNHIPGMPPFSSKLYDKQIRFAKDRVPFMVSLFSKLVSGSKRTERILFYTMSELEADAFRALQMAGISAYAVAPLLRNTDRQKAEEDGFPESASQAEVESRASTPVRQDERVDCISWLDTQAERSVIFVAFGSLSRLPDEDIRELAFGLEAGGTPFLWVLREGSYGGEQVLPDGFLERTRAKGMIVQWAPQVDVLGHKAVGGFLSHCGWNSVLESIGEGVPLLCCPLIGDQPANAYYICNVWGIGLELARTDSGALERKAVELGVRSLMLEEEGMEVRKKAREVMQLARKTGQKGGQSHSNMQKFYDDMKVRCLKPA